jgi:hypothetical protein
MGGSVTPMWQRPAPQSPSCFSELAQLGQCYNQVQWLTNLLTEIVTDIIETDTDVQQAIVDAIVATGSNVPLIGVTNGSNAQPGQVGEYIQWYIATQPFAVGDNVTQSVTLGVLQPGDWQCWCGFAVNGPTGNVWVQLNPTPAGFSTNMWGQAQEDLGTYGGVAGFTVLTMDARASLSVPTAVVYSLGIDNAATGATATLGNFTFGARRAR